jgi:hypothetical protein
MTQQHPITPTPELVQQWREQAPRFRDGGIAREDWLMTRAAQWGADQELEACVKLLELSDDNARDFLYSARRPKPPSLKQQALEQLDGIAAVFRMSHGGNLVCDTIRRALEQLDD